VIADSSSYPAVEGFRILLDGRVVATCTSAGVCPEIAAEPGVPLTYTARAFSAVGESRTAVQTTAWAYAAPAAPTGFLVEPTPSGTTGGVATITVTGVDATAGTVTLAGGTGGEVTQPGRGGVATFRDYRIGSNSPTPLTATPLTRSAPPPIPGGARAGTARSPPATGHGAPSLTRDVTASRGTDPGTVTATATVAPDGRGDRILVGFTQGGTCEPVQPVDAGGGTATRTFTDRELWTEVTIT